MMRSDRELIIGDHNWQQFVQDPVIDGEERKRGLVPRDYTKNPMNSYEGSQAIDMPLVNRSEVAERIAQQLATKSRLSDRRDTGMNGLRIPSRDQNGRGYCWIHSGCSAALLIRARDNQPYADLSAYMGACIIKNYRDEGGWGAQGIDWIREHGLPDSKFWPQKSVSRSNDTPECRANAKLYRVSEGWWDLNAAQYNRNLTVDQCITCLLTGIPVVMDFNWWGHSVCGADVVSGVSQWGVTRSESGKLLDLKQFNLVWGVDTVMTGLGIRIWNSWGDSWSEGGMGVLTGDKAVMNGGVAPRAMLASAA